MRVTEAKARFDVPNPCVVKPAGIHVAVTVAATVQLASGRSALGTLLAGDGQADVAILRS